MTWCVKLCRPEERDTLTLPTSLLVDVDASIDRYRALEVLNIVVSTYETLISFLFIYDCGIEERY